MKEAFLYYVWENRLLSGRLLTEAGETVEVISPGFRNFNSGPDFLEAKVRIGGRLWAGQVELHVRTSDWARHGHQHDKAYGNVVLHVVYEHDVEVNDIPVLALKGRFDEAMYRQYESLVTAQRWIPCERQLSQVQTFTVNTWLERMAVERLEDKAHVVGKMLEARNYDWEDTFYRLLLRYFGMKVNNEAFEYLTNILPFKILLKHADNLVQVEAMLLGCAGFLELDGEDTYLRLLQREFSVMRAKFGLLVMPLERWKFLRMRPVNFPTVRLAQLAQMIHRNGCLFSRIKEAPTADEAKLLFDVTASEYWDTHYRFSVEGPGKPKHLGSGTADVLMVNAVIPTLFCYGQFHKDERYCDKALRFLECIDAEDNTVVRHFTALGLRADNAMQSQAELQLYNAYCRRKRCLECRIGNILLQSNKD